MAPGVVSQATRKIFQNSILDIENIHINLDVPPLFQQQSFHSWIGTKFCQHVHGVQEMYLR